VKYLFILVLLIVAGCGALMAAVIVYRWIDNMTETVRVLPGERVFPMPAGVVPRGGELILPREQREIAGRRANPVAKTEASLATGKQHYVTFCAPCHGPEGKGGVTGPVASRFIPTPDLTNAEFQRQRTDGFWHSYILAGGAVMPAYVEALSAEEAWHVVNYLRSLVAGR
jgi:mono/diheme cytochrome c family protein